MPATAMAILIVDIMGLAASDLGGMFDSNCEDQHANTRTHITCRQHTRQYTNTNYDASIAFHGGTRTHAQTHTDMH